MHFRLTSTHLKSLSCWEPWAHPGTSSSLVPLSLSCSGGSGTSPLPVAWWPGGLVPALLSPQPVVLSTGVTEVSHCPGSSSSMFASTGSSVQLLTLLQDPFGSCNRPGMKSFLCLIVASTVRSPGSFLEQNLLFQQQKTKIKYIGLSLRKAHRAPECMCCKHCHSQKTSTG